MPETLAFLNPGAIWYPPDPMSTTADDLLDVRPRRQILSLVLAVLATVPGLVLRLAHIEVSHP
ncbi:MAG: hypothetical protein L0221_20290, partial [Chloroflexi bacterium]|nr:hypothetical protein [Chloroflexota bacterium]